MGDYFGADGAFDHTPESRAAGVLEQAGVKKNQFKFSYNRSRISGISFIFEGRERTVKVHKAFKSKAIDKFIDDIKRIVNGGRDA